MILCEKALFNLNYRGRFLLISSQYKSKLHEFTRLRISGLLRFSYLEFIFKYMLFLVVRF